MILPVISDVWPKVTKKHLPYALLIIALGFVLTLMTYNVRGTYRAAVGNGCLGPNGEMVLCWGELPRAGFPFPYYFDSMANSVVGQLNLVEDNFEGVYFLADVLFFAGALGAVFWGGSFLLRRK